MSRGLSFNDVVIVLDVTARFLFAFMTQFDMTYFSLAEAAVAVPVRLHLVFEKFTTTHTSSNLRFNE